jgi:hypothetical protein
MSNYKKDYYDTNKEKIVENAKLYYQNNKEKILERSKLYYKINKEKINAYNQKYWSKHGEKYMEEKKLMRLHHICKKFKSDVDKSKLTMTLYFN